MEKNWFCFLVAAAALGLLAYGNVGLENWPWLILGGLVLPLLLLIQKPSKLSRGPWVPGQGIAFGWMTPGLGLALLVLALVLRFYRLTSYRLWPTGDEGLNGFFALDLLHQWSWRFFYTMGDDPPLLTWSLRLFFEYFHSVFFNLWFLPAFFSALTAILGYGTARFYFQKPFAWICAFLLGFSFWPVYIGRFCHQGFLIPPFEIGCFWLWGLWSRAKSPGKARFWALALGLGLGLGTFTFTAWPVVIALMGLTALWTLRGKWKTQGKTFLFFLTGLELACLPFEIAFIREGYGHHLLDVSSARGWFSPLEQIHTSLSYLTTVFWGYWGAAGSYGPLWGGMLNPLLGACALLGLAEGWCRRNSGWAKWIFAALSFSFLPGLLSADYVEMFRVAQAMPVVLLLSALGLNRLLLSTPISKRTFVLILILLVSAALDGTHLMKGADPAANSPQALNRPDENYRAYRILEAQARQEGPGLIYTDFLLLSHGHTLAVCVYPFNAAQNPSLDSGLAQWAAVIANVNYGPFLLKRFPNMRWISVGTDLSSDGGLAVGIIALTPDGHTLFNQWLETHRYFHKLNLEAERIQNQPAFYAEALKRLPEGEKWMGHDPFLESLFGEWRAQYHYGAGGYQENEALLSQAIQKGYPAAHLYFKLGNFLWLEGKKQAAKEAYTQAAGQEPKLTQAAQALALLESGR